MKFLIALCILVVVACQAEKDEDTAITTVENSLLRTLPVRVKKVYETSNEVCEGNTTRQYLAGRWDSRQKIWNTTFTVKNGSIAYSEGGAGNQYYIIKVDSKPGLTLSWCGEIWTYI